MPGNGHRHGEDEKAQQCGWLKDKYGPFMASCPQHFDRNDNPEKFQRTMTAMLQMKKIDIDELKYANAG
jgi:predicted 3-demethylubiquinone-9 3-methyltransferase (glyoxalase superfamily)